MTELFKVQLKLRRRNARRRKTLDNTKTFKKEVSEISRPQTPDSAEVKFRFRAAFADVELMVVVGKRCRRRKQYLAEFRLSGSCVLSEYMA